MKGFSVLAWLVVAVSMAMPLPGATPNGASYKVGAGPYAVETVNEVVLHDAKRNKDLPVFVSYPKGDGMFPVIVFSHGAMAAGDMGFPIVEHWTSHGYVVLCPTHEDSMNIRRSRGQDGTSGTRRPVRPLGESNSIGRPRDVTFLLDSLHVLERKVPSLRSKLDGGRVGVGGHSLGAFTAQVVGGATLTLGGTDKPQTFADPRVKAILQLSGQGKDQQGLHEHSWDNLTLPMMCVTGSLDRGAQGQSPEWKRDPFEYAPAGHKYFLFIEGAHHGSFNGKTAAGAGESRFGATAGAGAGRLQQLTPEQRERLGGRFGGRRGGIAGERGDQKVIFDWVTQATSAFWDASLKNDAAGRAWLASPALGELSGGRATLDRK